MLKNPKCIFNFMYFHHFIKLIIKGGMGLKGEKFVDIYTYILLVWVSVCLFVSNKRQNCWSDRTQILCGSHIAKGKVYGPSKFHKFPSAKFIVFVLQCIQREMDAKRTESLVSYISEKAVFFYIFFLFFSYCSLLV